MESFMNGAVLIQAALLSFLLGLWVTWIGLRGLFRLMPEARLEAAPIRLVARRDAGASRSHAA
jgi:hypothetical protein